ncbi:uridylate kinase [Bacteroidia bacterium]|nr:uridylate kinase [Bacteroidia bacterium]
MKTVVKYRTVLLKLSGESLMGSLDYGLDPAMLQQYASDIKEAYLAGCRIGIVIGGGNIYRGMQGATTGIDRARGDYMGMMATLINSIALQDTLEQMGVSVRLLSGLAVDPIAEKMSRERAKRYLDQNNVVIMAAGTGNPYFTTDTGATLRALEIEADIFLKGTRVDGIYTADPEKDPTAIKYDRIHCQECYEKKLKIMDLTAFALCSDSKLPICVFDMNKKGNLYRIINGEHVGTLVHYD